MNIGSKFDPEAKYNLLLRGWSHGLHLQESEPTGQKPAVRRPDMIEPYQTGLIDSNHVFTLSVTQTLNPGFFT